MRAAHDDAPAQAEAVEVFVDDAVAAGVQRGRGDVVGLQIVRGRPLVGAARGEVVGADEADDLVGEQPADVQLGGRLQPVADDQIDLAAGEPGAVVELGRQRVDGDAGAGRLLAQPGDEGGQEERVDVVAGGDAELDLGRAGREGAAAGLAAEELLGAAQQGFGRLHQLQRDLGRHHAAARPHQQRVADQCAQPLELCADDRLGGGQVHRGPRDTAFGDHGVEDPDEMKLDGVENGAARHTCILILVITPDP